jgi:hypothetical protein
MWALSSEILLSLRSKVSRRPSLKIHNFTRSGKLLASSRVRYVPAAHIFFAEDGILKHNSKI